MDFTYESTNTDKLETYEWDNTWVDHAKSDDRMRVLYIGDSISCGTRKHITERSQERIYCDGFGTSKALDHPYFKISLIAFAKQVKKYDAIVFNNGLHGWHLEDRDEYAALYDDMIGYLRSEFPTVPLYVALTTHVARERDEARVKARNEGARAAAEKHGANVIDLYALTLENADLISSDGVHYLTAGYEKIADLIISNILKNV